jgi:hypothetical protein
MIVQVLDLLYDNVLARGFSFHFQPPNSSCGAKWGEYDTILRT